LHRSGVLLRLVDSAALEDGGGGQELVLVLLPVPVRVPAQVQALVLVLELDLSLVLLLNRMLARLSRTSTSANAKLAKIPLDKTIKPPRAYLPCQLPTATVS
jgi:hypothetical protein